MAELDSSTSYGPAQERRTRTPVKFAKLRPGQEGEYEGPTLIDMIKNTLPLLQGRELPNRGSITLDPTSANFNLGRDTKHEAIHSLLMPAQFDIDKTVQGTPGFNQIAQVLMKLRAGNALDEVPAYMGSFDQKQTQIPQNWRDEYVSKLKEALFKLNPKMGQLYGELSK